MLHHKGHFLLFAASFFNSLSLANILLSLIRMAQMYKKTAVCTVWSDHLIRKLSALLPWYLNLFVCSFSPSLLAPHPTPQPFHFFCFRLLYLFTIFHQNNTCCFVFVLWVWWKKCKTSHMHVCLSVYVWLSVFICVNDSTRFYWNYSQENRWREVFILLIIFDIILVQY